LAQSLISAGGLFVLELIAISTWLDTNALDGKGGLMGAVGDWGPHILQSLVILTTVLLALGYSKAQDTLVPISNMLADTPPAWRFSGGPLRSDGRVRAALDASLRRNSFRGKSAGSVLADRWNLWRRRGHLFLRSSECFSRALAVSAGTAWIYAGTAAIVTPMLVVASDRLWKPAAALTFEMIKVLLRPFDNAVIANSVARTIGTQKFRVEIAPSSSGLEGVGLMLIFSILWLWFFRSDYKFPRALLLIPIGVVVIFLLNAVRIATLILIGNAGARAIAVGRNFIRRPAGLHSMVWR
jgi:exosortase/archaeosortase family protein